MTQAQSPPEGVHVACLMLASQSKLVASAILADVLRMRFRQALNGSIDGFHASLVPHGLC